MGRKGRGEGLDSIRLESRNKTMEGYIIQEYKYKI